MRCTHNDFNFDITCNDHQKLLKCSENIFLANFDDLYVCMIIKCAFEQFLLHDLKIYIIRYELPPIQFAEPHLQFCILTFFYNDMLTI